MASTRKKTGQPKPKKNRRKLRIALISAGSIIGLVALALFIYVVIAISQTPSWTPEALSNQKESSIVMDKNGNKIAQLHAEENRLIATYEEIPDIVKNTFIAVEDKRFYSHFGFDPIRILGALVADIRKGTFNEGGSTITIQLARNAFIDDPTSRSLTRKIQEVALAVQLERQYTKEEILTFYLNRIPLGERSFGIKAAALTYFGKDLNELEPDEVALLAGLPQATTAYNPYINPDKAKNRRNIVLGVMRDNSIISAEDYDVYKEKGFPYVEQVQASGETKETETDSTATKVQYDHPYFVDYVIEELTKNYNMTEDQIFNGGLTIYTTVDTKIQEAAEAAFADPNNFPKSVDEVPVQGAITALDNSTGEIVAMVGGRDYTPRGLNRAADAKRQPGSTIKPLVVYAAALEKGGYYPGTVFDDMPVEYDAGNGKTWAPVDFDTETAGWKGLITMREALRNSVNVYAVRLMKEIGVNYGWQFGKENMGLPLTDNDKYLTLALGTAQVSTLNMAEAYSTFPNSGVRITPHAVTKVLDANGKEIITAQVNKKQVIKETTAYLINDMLRTVVTSGTGTSARLGNWAVCGKTGTSSLPEDYGTRSGNVDAWFAGYTPKYTAVVWMGYDKDEDKNHYLRKVYGGSFPAKIWKQVMTAAHEGLDVVTQYPRPTGIVSVNYDRKSGLLPSSLTPEEFLGTEIAAQGSIPTRVSEVWQEKEVDADNPTYLAGPATINKITKVFINVTGRDETTPWPNDEAPYKPPTENAPNTVIDADNPPSSSPSAPPTGDPSLPTLSPTTLSYDAPKSTVTLNFSPLPNGAVYGVVVYVKHPGEDSVETYRPKGQLGQATSVSIPLNRGGRSLSPGDYTFWLACTDLSGTIVGPPSTSLKLAITD